MTMFILFAALGPAPEIARPRSSHALCGNAQRMTRTRGVGIGRALLLVAMTCVAGTAGSIAVLLLLDGFKDFPFIISWGGTLGLVVGVFCGAGYLIYLAVSQANARSWKDFLRPALAAMGLAIGYTWWAMSALASI